MSQLRKGANALRYLSSPNLGAYAFTDPDLTGVEPKVVHVNELRSVITSARTGLGLPVITFTDPTLTTDTLIRHEHVNELWGGLR
jgi:hypothetical protein